MSSTNKEDTSASSTHHHYKVVVIGGGIGGICTAVKLLEAGITDFIVLEQSAGLGGVWRDNVYPGCACDIPFHLYSFSFCPAPLSAQAFPSHKEILHYLESVAESYGLWPYFKFRQRVAGATWDDENGQWRIEHLELDQNGQKSILTADYVVSCTGQLNIPKYPAFYRETTNKSSKVISLHSARYDPKLGNLQGKTVALVGNGASGVQILQAIRPSAKKIYVYERSPKWHLTGCIFSVIHKVVKAIGWTWLSRAVFFAAYELFHEVLFLHLNRTLQWFLFWMDPEHYKGDAIPNYRVGCNRILVSSTYTQDLRADNVVVIKDPIEGCTDEGYLQTTTGEVASDVDVIIYATGFQLNDCVPSFPIRGRDGVLLADQWKQRADSTLYGIVTEEFPNWFSLGGPNTSSTAGSIIFFTECALGYILQALHYAEKHQKILLVRPQATKKYLQVLQKMYLGRPELDSCSSWYTKTDKDNKSALPTITNFPGSMTHYWWHTRRFQPNDFDLIERPGN